jgi:hypothetical protein
MTQDEALEILKMGHNVYLTGAAGAGKTFVLNEYIRFLRSKNIEVGVTASTGIAATHMNGITIHSWAGMGVKDSLTDAELRALVKKRYLAKRFNNTKVLVIDEISMLHAHRLDLVDRIARVFKGNFEAFGGMQVVLCGDFFQLPPVSRFGEPPPHFVNKSHIWNNMDMRVCYLHEQYRQTDMEHLRILQTIRADTVDDDTRNSLERRRGGDIFGMPHHTRLFTHNVDVDSLNRAELARLEGEERRFVMEESGHEVLADILKKSTLALPELILKEGALVMFVKNNFEKGYVNGTLGTVVAFEKDEFGKENDCLPVVETISGKRITATKEIWELEEDGESVAEIKQIPLRLAWAITVHKSQGMSLDAAEIDLSRSFEPGMGYVALSRVRTLAGLRLTGLNETALKVNPEILIFDRELERLSDEMVWKLREIPAEERVYLQKKFLNSIGVKTKTHKSERLGADEFCKEKFQAKQEKKAYSVDEIRKITPKAYKKWTQEEDEKLVESFTRGKKIPLLAVLFERKNGAIRSRLKKLGLLQE